MLVKACRSLLVDWKVRRKRATSGMFNSHPKVLRLVLHWLPSNAGGGHGIAAFHLHLDNAVWYPRL